MSSKDKNLSKHSDLPSAKGLKIHIAVSEWNTEITGNLLDGCRKTLEENGIEKEDIQVVYTPGSFELPFAAKALIKNNHPDAVVCLGCVIKGETQHDEYINMAVAQGLIHLSMVSDTPVIFGVLTVNDMQQAKDRAGGKYGNKGVESAVTAIRMVQLKKSFNKSKKTIGY